VAEIWVHPPSEAALYVRPDELNQVFNFDLLTTAFDANLLYESIESAFSILRPVGALPTWALSNHDSPRVASRLGVAESKALFIALLALPGSLYIYNGQELSLPDADVADEFRQDPVYFRTQGAQKGRDSARVPLPWNSQATNLGFTTGKPWLPIPDQWQKISIDVQDHDEESSLNLYRRGIQLRKSALEFDKSIVWQETGARGLLVFQRGSTLVLLNTSTESCSYEVVGEIILASTSTISMQDARVTLPSASACWVRLH
jgi:alpha-glucosidase